jgi:DNA-binding CsgD family transcriptional regulator
VNLLEREKCLANLSTWLADVPRSGGSVVLVGAEAGLGKTSLLREFASRHPQTRLLWGACDALFTPRPLAPVLDIARDAGGSLWQAVQGKADRDEVFRAALDEFEQKPALVVFEDLHWADEATLDFVKYLARRVGRTRALAILTYRDDEVLPGHPLHFVLGDLPRASTHRLNLEPLSKEAVASLAREAGRPARDLHRITAGNPLFVTEVLASSDATVPRTIRDAVIGRTARLTPGSLRIAQAVSVVPAAAEAWLIEALLQPRPAEIDACLAIGMRRLDDGAISYRHELVRRAVEVSLAPMQRRQLHAAVLQALAGRPDVAPARLAHHAAGAEDAAAVLQYATAAAVQATSVGAHREAAAHYATALRAQVDLDPARRAELLERLAYEYYLTDQIDLSLDARRTALEQWSSLGDRLREGDTQRWLSRLSWFAGRRADAERYATQAVATLEPLPAGRELALAYSNQAQLEMLAFRVEAATQWATRAIDLASALGDDEVLCHALNNRGAASHFGGGGSGHDDLERSLHIALEHNFQEHAARAYTNLAATAVGCRDYRTGQRYLEEGIGYCEQHDLDSWRLYMLAWRGRMNFERGDWLEAGNDLESVVANPRTAVVARLPALITLAHLRLRRGDPDVETPLVEARQHAGVANEIQRTAPLTSVVAESAYLTGDLEVVLEELRAACAAAFAQTNPWLRGEMAIWLWRAGDLKEIPAGIAEPYALEMQGNWRDAAAAWDALGCPHEHACMLAWYGDEAAQRVALEHFDRSGAGPAAQLVRQKMRASGIRSVPRGSRKTTKQNQFNLTRREAQILELMRTGMRNSAIARRLFLSTRTVDHHVSSVLNKLGVATRAEAIALVVTEVAGG